MKADRQGTARFGLAVDYESQKSDSPISPFRGLKIGVIITIIIFWLPFMVISRFLGWPYLLVYGMLLVAAFTALGLVSRYYGLNHPSSIQKPLAKF
jgi:hypothetical protein